MDCSCDIVSVWTSRLRGGQIIVFNYCTKLQHLIFSSRSLKLLQSWILLWKYEVIAVNWSVIVKHTFNSCSLSVRCFEIIFWKLLFWRLREWFERGCQYVCWHGDWSLRQYCQFVLPVFKEINASRLDLCFSIFLEPRPLEKVSQILRTPSTKLSQIADR